MGFFGSSISFGDVHHISYKFTWRSLGAAMACRPHQLRLRVRPVQHASSWFKVTCWLVCWRFGRLPGLLLLGSAGLMAAWLAGWLAAWLAGWLAAWPCLFACSPVCWLVDLLYGYLGCLVGLLVAWLACCQAALLGCMVLWLYVCTVYGFTVLRFQKIPNFHFMCSGRY